MIIGLHLHSQARSVGNITTMTDGLYKWVGGLMCTYQQLEQITHCELEYPSKTVSSEVCTAQT